MSPFFANKGYHPSLEIDIEQSSGTTFAADLETLNKVHEHCKDELAKANEVYADNANKHQLPFPELQPGDRVWISTKNIRTTRPTPKLSERYIGPFPIDKAISKVAYRVSLPEHLRALHPVFHVSLLEPHVEDTLV